MSTDTDRAAEILPLPPYAEALADAIAAVAPAVVAIQAGEHTASGLVYSATEGHVLTTTRLLQRHQGEVRVLFHDGEGRSAELVGYDDATELALLRVDECPASELRPARADILRVGHIVAPVGRNLYGVRAAFGMVAGLGGAWVTPKGGAIDAWIDVDGRLPPGFSGGPLVDLAGNVVGVNTRGILREGTVLPLTTVERVAAQLAQGGSVSRGFLGVGVQSVKLPDAVARTAGQPEGLLVTRVGRKSAAAGAELMAGDTLVAVEGRPLARLADLVAALSGRAGAEVSLRYVRAGAVIDASVVASERPEPRGGRHEHLDHGHHEDRGGRGQHDGDEPRRHEHEHGGRHEHEHGGRHEHEHGDHHEHEHGGRYGHGHGHGGHRDHGHGGHGRRRGGDRGDHGHGHRGHGCGPGRDERD